MNSSSWPLTIIRFEFFTISNFVHKLNFEQCNEPFEELIFRIKSYRKTVLIGVEGNNKLVFAVSPPVDVEAGFHCN